jgi:hypothetical protein
VNPAEVVVSEIDRKHCFQVLPLLAESVRQSCQSADRCSIRSDNEGPDEESPWHQQIERATDPYCVRLKARPQTAELSEAEKNVIGKIFERYGRMNRYKLRDLLHEVLPEWQDPQGSSLPITYRDILSAGGKSEPEITQILSAIEASA